MHRGNKFLNISKFWHAKLNFFIHHTDTVGSKTEKEIQINKYKK